MEIDPDYVLTAIDRIESVIAYIETHRPVKSRENSLALTKLDEAVMWLKKGRE